MNGPRQYPISIREVPISATYETQEADTAPPTRELSDEEKYYRQSWMNDEQWECAQFLADFYGGWHHVHGKVKDASPTGIHINTRHISQFATYDFDGLTRLVVMAHDRAIRVQVGPSGPGMLELMFHKRTREGDSFRRHPTLEDAISRLRGQSG